ncbi:MAG: hypothetical protein R3174_11595 [Gammaproteobacteria bacterium]|nr:hypothetical protein [Gammaproteobacteria bacterium]
MEISVKLLVRRGQGALANAAEVLSAGGFRFYDHALKVVDDERAELLIRAEGDGNPEMLESALGALEPILKVEEILPVDDAAAAETDAEPEPEPAPPDPWVDQVVRAWPDVLELLHELSASIPEDERVHRFTILGVGVGRALYHGHAPASVPTSIDDGLARVVLPAIEPVARGKVHGHVVRVRETEFCCGEMVDLLFTPVEEEGGYCCLLSGIIAGMLNEIPDLAPVRVTETRCLARGEPVCDFEVEEIPR